LGGCGESRRRKKEEQAERGRGRTGA
jgi:hypothetical protein